jgi:arginyl-tRNA synthetase
MDSRTALVEAIVQAAGLETQIVDKLLTTPREIAHGDYALPCFPLAKEWKLSPPDCAAKLANDIVLPPEISRFEIVGPYINFFRNRGAYHQPVRHRHA